MSFTYSPGAGDDLNDIRSDIGDTQATAPESERLEDEEIFRLIARCGTKQAATLQAAQALIAKLTRRATEKGTGALRIVYAQRIENLWRLANDIKDQAAFASRPYCGGISVSDAQAVAANTDRVQPAFTAGMLDNPRVGS